VFDAVVIIAQGVLMCIIWNVCALQRLNQPKGANMELADQLIDTWTINNRINLYMLDAIEDAALPCVGGIGGRSVAAQFAHIHNVRLMWLDSAAPELLEQVSKIATKTKADKDAITRQGLAQALEASGHALESLLRQGLAAGRIKGFKPHAAAFLGYLVAHESYHRAEVGIILTECGHPLPDKISYGLWEWGVR
jgi:uncharacterized damage-inducible protein DinB